MVKCEGLPDSSCPNNAGGSRVKMCQGDLMLCSDCKELRFGCLSNCTNPDEDQNNTDLSLNSSADESSFISLNSTLQSPANSLLTNSIVSELLNDTIVSKVITNRNSTSQVSQNDDLALSLSESESDATSLQSVDSDTTCVQNVNISHENSHNVNTSHEKPHLIVRRSDRIKQSTEKSNKSAKATKVVAGKLKRKSIKQSDKINVNVTCDTCKKDFASKASLKRHRRTHTSKPAVDPANSGKNDTEKSENEDCDLSKRVDSESETISQNHTQTGEKPLDTRTGEKPLDTHTGEKPLDTHTGEKPLDTHTGKSSELKSNAPVNTHIQPGEKDSKTIETEDIIGIKCIGTQTGDILESKSRSTQTTEESKSVEPGIQDEILIIRSQLQELVSVFGSIKAMERSLAELHSKVDSFSKMNKIESTDQSTTQSKGTLIDSNDDNANTKDDTLLITDETLVNLQPSDIKHGVEVVVIKKNSSDLKSLKPLLDHAIADQVTYSNMYIHTGASMCENEDISPSVANDAKTLLQTAQRVAQNVCISSVIPRLDNEKYLQNSVALNDIYQSVCSEMDVTFIDHDMTFRLANGSVNEHFVDEDKLTKPGYKQVMTNLGLNDNSNKHKMQAMPVEDRVDKVNQLQKDLPEKSHSSNSNTVPKRLSTSHPLKQKTPATKRSHTISVQGHKDKLSNFYPCKMYYHGITFDSSEQLYQYKRWEYHAKSEENEYDSSTLKLIMNAKHAGEAKRVADKRIQDCENWSQAIAKETMCDILELKASQSLTFANALLDTKDAYLLHTVPDAYWGEGSKSKKGRNTYGEILMALRSKLMMKKRPKFNYIPVDDRSYAEVTRDDYQPKYSHTKNHMSTHTGSHSSESEYSAASNFHCDYCYETGHSKNTCGFKHPVKCYSCKRLGHKAKFCY